MFVLFSGEGITDLGAGNSQNEVARDDEFTPGPMAIIADRIMERKLDYSVIDAKSCGYVSEQVLARHIKQLKPTKKGTVYPGKRREQETGYFFKSARALSKIAVNLESEFKDVIAILFRDSDGSASSGRGLWDSKLKSMIDGFNAENFSKGVPMIPKPKSEVWFICALKRSPYQNCRQLEDAASGNDSSPKSLKKQLEKILGEKATFELLCKKAANDVDIDLIHTKSFVTFRKRLEETL